ncbi:multiple inositol polyphosphate phosphatase 1-like [Helicoverpa zea]|uniref:multiple inositol polyphosphate phosphatase 1-like n=1 Tax=Helicoverpa zea TaxID=7113 RepID=UPI001F5A3B8E|nr:multiple inositol polyphosphate phosphatase 1-like [Helicoverpa zea]
MLRLLLVVLTVVNVKACYWNSQCTYQLFGSKTPYDTVRGDIRDHPLPAHCQAVSIWTLNRHGNRNPGTSVTVGMKEVADLRDEIINSYLSGTSQLCAQDIEDFRKFNWNSTLETTQSYLTGVGYEELYDIAKRIREKYPHLLYGSADKFYLRPTNEQRTITSCAAFAHGFTDGKNLNLTIDEPRTRDDVIRPYENCDRYQQDVKAGPTLAYQLDSYFISPEYIAIQNAVQYRLGLSTKLNASSIFSMYEMCRFLRSWTKTLKSPWCAPFTEQDLITLEYYDDIRHYYRNGYGSWVNENLGRLPLKDLYDNFLDVVQGKGRKLNAYFTHDTMMEMVFCALGLYKEDPPIQALLMDPERVWRTSYIGAFSGNLMAVLNSCLESGTQHSYKVQLFINEKPTPICPLTGCTWEEFQEKFKPFTNANLDFCSMTYVHDVEDEHTSPSTNAAPPTKAFWNWY